MRGMAREYAAGNSLGPGWRSLRGSSVVRWVGRRPVPSGREWNGSQPRCRARVAGKARLNFSAQGQSIRKICRSGWLRGVERVSRVRPGTRTAAGSTWWWLSAAPRTLTIRRRPAGQVVGHRLDGQPGADQRRRSGPRGMVQPDAALEVAYGILDLGVAAMVSLQFEQLPVPVGDEAVIAVFGEEGTVGNRARLHPPDDEPVPFDCPKIGVCLGLEGGPSAQRLACHWGLSLGHIGGTVHPHKESACHHLREHASDETQAFVLASNGDG